MGYYPFMAANKKTAQKPAEPINNVQAVSRYLDGLYPDGIPREHWPIVQVVRSLAVAVDTLPDQPALWKQYREALCDLDELHAYEEDKLDAIITRLQAPVDNTED